MVISKDIVKKIEAEYSDWFESQYHGMGKKERQKLGALKQYRFKILKLS